MPKFPDPRLQPKLTLCILHTWHGPNHKHTRRGILLPHAPALSLQMSRVTRLRLHSWPLCQTRKPYFSRPRRCYTFLLSRCCEQMRGPNTPPPRHKYSADSDSPSSKPGRQSSKGAQKGAVRAFFQPLRPRPPVRTNTRTMSVLTSANWRSSIINTLSAFSLLCRVVSVLICLYSVTLGQKKQPTCLWSTDTLCANRLWEQAEKYTNESIQQALPCEHETRCSYSQAAHTSDI